MRLLQSPRGLSPTGSAASLAGPVLPLVAGAIYAGFRWPEIVLFPQRPSLIWQALGWVWLAFGLAFWVATLLRFVPRWTRGELITSGPYALCRHPLYALVPFFILPAVGLITQNRAYFLIALISFPLALHAGAREEAELLRLYGRSWTDYASRTSRLLPLPAAGHMARLLARVAWVSAALIVLYLSILQPFHVS
jgi:protein-S-isoprenylcysteine O-methyltransferase Ste14